MKKLLTGFLFIICAAQFISCTHSNGQGTQSPVKYMVVSTSTMVNNYTNGYQDFAQAVMNKLNEGWKLSGGVSVSEKVFYQALYK